MLSLVFQNRLYTRSLNSGEAKVNRVNCVRNFTKFICWRVARLSLKCMHVSHLCNNVKVTKIVC